MANKRADRVWLRLVQSYGSRVAEAYGEDIPQIWTDAIDDLTDEQIAYGLRKVSRDTPIHPPTLGQFVAACADMPQPEDRKGPTIQEQLCAYGTLQLHGQGGPIGLSLWEFSRPWTYVYREWTDETKPKHFQKQAECMGVVIDLADGTRMGFSVANMLADKAGHAKAMKSFQPGPPPNQRQKATWLDAIAEHAQRGSAA